MEEEKFNYAAAVAELEALVAGIEDPAAGIDDIGKSVAKAEELVKKCRAYLREAQVTGVDHRIKRRFNP